LTRSSIGGRGFRGAEAVDRHHCRAKRELQRQFDTHGLGAFRQRRNQLDAAAQMRGCFTICRACRRAPSGCKPIAYRAQGIAGFAPVMAKNFRLARRALRFSALDCERDAPVQRLAGTT
jgi:hypothetical protein